MYNKVNNINFTANMDIFFVKKDQKRWDNIAKIYEDITLEYPNDTFDISNNGNRYFEFSAFNINSKDGISATMNLCKNGYADLMKFSDKEIAKKFKNILKVAHQNNINNKKAIEFCEAVGLSDKNRTELMKIMNTHKKETQESIIQNDTFLSSIDLEFQ